MIELAEQYEAEARAEYGALSADELDDLPTLAQGQADDLKIESNGWRVWLCRCGVEDGMPYDDAVTVETEVNGRWIEVAMFPAGEGS